MRRKIVTFARIVPLVILQACSGGGGSGPPSPMMTTPPAITQSYAFPSGDATATSGTAWDIVGLKTTLTGSGHDTLGNAYDHLKVDVTFVQDVSNALPAPGATAAPNGSQLGISISIDSDGNSATGTAGVCASSSSAHPFEYITEPGIFQSRLPDGNYTIIANNVPIYSGPPNPDAEAVASSSGHTVSFVFNLSTLGVFSGSKIPRIGVGAASFSTTGPSTDCVPTGNNGVFEVYTTSN